MYKFRSSGLGTTVSPGLGRVPMLVLVPPRLSNSRVFIPITKPTLAPAPASLRHQPLVTGWSRRNWGPGHSNPCRELLYICHHSHPSIGHTSRPGPHRDLLISTVRINKGTSKYDVITLRDIFTPPPLLSYCVIIRRTSGWW